MPLAGVVCSNWPFLEVLLVSVVAPLTIKQFFNERIADSVAERTLIRLLGRPTNLVRIELFHHDPSQFLLRVGHHGDEVLVHRRPKPQLVLVRGDDGRVLVRDRLLQVALELLLQRVLLNVVDDPDAHRAFLRIDHHQHRVVDN